MNQALGIFLIALTPAVGADLTHATVVVSASLTGPERKAVALLVDSVRERTRITWAVTEKSPAAGNPVVTVRQAPPYSTVRSL